MAELSRGFKGIRAPALSWRADPQQAAVLFLLISLLIAVSVGPVSLSPIIVLKVLARHLLGLDAEVEPAFDAIIWQIRLPRVLLAGLVGACLSLCGAAYQGVFRNPLADPYLLGIASGAGLAQTAVIVFSWGLILGGFDLLILAGFVGAMVSVLAAYGMARVNGQAPSGSLILAGVAISSINVAAISYLMLAHQESASRVLTMLLGSFNSSTWRDLSFMAPYFVPAGLVIFAHGRLLNVMQLGEDEARQAGLETERTRLVLLIAASLATAAAVSVSGIVGFVGLIVPHGVRLLFGPDYRRLLPLSALSGAGFLMLADTCARTLIEPGELPVGVITSFLGVPFFLYLLRRQRRVYF